MRRAARGAPVASSTWANPWDAIDIQAPHLWYLAQSLGAGWAGDVDGAERWLTPLLERDRRAWAGDAAEWVRARFDADPENRRARLAALADGTLTELPAVRALVLVDALRAGDARAATHDAAVTMLHEMGAGALAASLLPESTTAAAHDDALAALSDRERDVTTLLLEGLSYAQIAQELFVTRSTVAFHLSRVYAKTGTKSRHELVAALRGR